ncbi:MAG: hypothetical protein AB7S36_11385 [Planctomycetota bacterium]
MHKEHSADGLKIFTFERQGSPTAEITNLINGKGGAGYSISAGGCNAYRGNGGIPMAWIIDVTGRVIFAGNPGGSDFDNKIAEALKKVPYPGVGKDELHKDLDKAVKEFTTSHDYAKARDEATKVIESDRSEEAAKTDATYMIERIATVYKRHLDAAKDFEAKKRYGDARAEWEWVIEAFGARSEEGKAAKDRITEYGKDKEIKEELKAEDELGKLRTKLEQMAAGKAPLDRRLKEVEKFTKKYEGTGAAGRANAELADLLK